jgi:hypothetical protein
MNKESLHLDIFSPVDLIDIRLRALKTLASLEKLFFS